MKNRKDILILLVFIFLLSLSLLFCFRKIFFRPEEVVYTKVAIVIDDWGYNLHCINLLKKINVPITISILPNLKYSSKIARLAKSQNLEVILHLPLEPEREGRKLGLEEQTITTEMSDKEVIKNFRLALSSVPYACGVSNHMGSRATQDSRLISVLLGEVKKRDLFFLDNLVTDKSVCQELAKKMKVKFICRDFFLDNLDDSEYIKEQFRKLSEFALEHTQAVGIGHAKSTTLEVLRNEIASMQAKGIKFVFVSDLAN